jgi:hypothetical protein
MTRVGRVVRDVAINILFTSFDAYLLITESRFPFTQHKSSPISPLWFNIEINSARFFYRQLSSMVDSNVHGDSNWLEPVFAQQ